MDRERAEQTMFDAPGSSEYIKPNEHVGHVFIVRPLQHIPNVPGFNPKPNGQPSDGILIDGVILTKMGADGAPVTFRGQTWGHSRLIASLKNSIGKMVLGRIIQGTSKPGQQSVPLELQDLTTDPQAVAAAQQWVDAHPGWFDTALPTAVPVAAPAPAPAQVPYPTAQPIAFQGPVTQQPAPVGYAPVSANQYAQPAQPVQQAMPYAAPVAPVAPAPVAPVQYAAPVAAVAQAPAQNIIQGAIWDQLAPAKQAEMQAQGYQRGA